MWTHIIITKNDGFRVLQWRHYKTVLDKFEEIRKRSDTVAQHIFDDVGNLINVEKS